MGTKYSGNKKEVRALNAYINLLRAAESISGRVHAELLKLSEVDLSVSQFGVLEALYYLGPLCQKDLAQKILKTGGNITLVVANLGKRGLLKRHREKNDQRYWRVELSPKGKELVSRVMKPHVANVVKKMSVLTQDEQDTLRILCRWVGTGGRDR